jgi:hypothetical protein
LHPLEVDAMNLPEMPAGVEIREVPGLDGYAASTDGRIWHKCKGERWEEKPACDNGYGYLKAHFYTPLGRKTFKVHRIILLTFYGPKPEGMDGCHRDGNRHNNRLDNLRWDSRSNNNRDTIANNRGLSEEVIVAIQALRRNGFSCETIAKDIGTSVDVARSLTHEDYERLIVNSASHRQSTAVIA